jgi:hypothetical protein
MEIDFSEPIPKMVQRLKNEHHVFRLEFIKIEETKSSVIANVILAPSSKLLVKVLGYLVF